MLRWAPIRSRAVRAVGYDTASRDLHVVYAGGGHYLYRKVPARKVQALLAAPSKGRFVNLQIKPCFAYEEVGPEASRRLQRAH